MTGHKAKLSIIIPVYNEKGTFGVLIEQVIAKNIPGIEKEIIIIESNSTDGTREQVQAYENRAGIKTVYQDRARGKGNAVRTGLTHATGDMILIQDADLEYDVNDYDKLLDPLLSGRYSFVLGSRHLGRGNWRIRSFSNDLLTALSMNIGHQLFAFLLNLFYSTNLKDPFTMFKVFRKECLRGLELECNRFDFDFELVTKLIRKGFVPAEIPIGYKSRPFSEGKKVRLLRDPISWIVALIKYRFFWNCRVI